MKREWYALAAVLVSSSALAGGHAPKTSEFDLQRTTKTINVSGVGDGKDGGENKDREEITLDVVDSHGPVSGAECRLTNDLGKWSVTPPGTAFVRRSKDALRIECMREGYETSVGVLEASLKEISKKHFHFSADDQDDSDEEEHFLVVPHYPPNVNVTLIRAGGE